MKPPRRWLDSPDVPDDIADLLRAQPLPGAIPEAAKQRGRMHAARLAAVPAGAVVSWLSVKAVAAVAAVGSVAVASGVVLTHSEPDDALVGTSPSPAQPAVAQPARPAAQLADARESMEPDPAEKAAAAPVEVEKGPAPAASGAPPHATLEPSRSERARGVRAAAWLSPAAEAPRSAAVPSLEQGVPQPVAPVADTLEREATLLEGARALLTSDAAEALRVARQHAVEFPRGQLWLERRLIEADALGRLGRVAEARAVANGILASLPGAIYEERVRALLRRLGD